MGDCIDKNMIDKDEYPQTAEIESRCGAHHRRPLELAQCRYNDRLLDNRIKRSREARRVSAEVEIAKAA